MASGLYVETFEAAFKNDLALDMDNDTSVSYTHLTLPTTPYV